MFQHRNALRHVLAPADYSDPDVHRDELERLFAPGWHYLAPAEHLASPGQYVARDVLGKPVLVRNVEGRLRAFRNVCAHRHTLVVRPGRGRVENLRCQYHGWEYDGGGRACRIPDGASFRGFRADGLRLDELPVEKLGAMVFVALRDDAPSLRSSLGDFADEIDAFYGNHRLIWEWDSDHDVNWKVIAENAIESYHVPMTHPNTFQDYRPEELHDHTLGPGYTRYRDLKPWGSRWVERGIVKFARWMLPSDRLQRFTQAHMFPNYLLYYSEIYANFISLEPDGPGRTRHVQLGFVPRDLRWPVVSRALQELFVRGFVPGARRIIVEDMKLWPDIQHGLENSPHEGILSAREERVFHFQRWVADRLGRDVPADLSAVVTAGGEG